MSQTIIGIVSPLSHDDLPAEGPRMYPGVKFIARGVGVKALTPEGYASMEWYGSDAYQDRFLAAWGAE